MSEKDRGLCVFLAGVALVVLGATAYGLVTGDIPTLGGNRYESDLIWRSREQEPRYFWFAVGWYLFVAGGAGWLAVRLLRGKD